MSIQFDIETANQQPYENDLSLCKSIFIILYLMIMIISFTLMLMYVPVEGHSSIIFIIALIIVCLTICPVIIGIISICFYHMILI